MRIMITMRSRTTFFLQPTLTTWRAPKRQDVALVEVLDRLFQHTPSP